MTDYRKIVQALEVSDRKYLKTVDKIIMQMRDKDRFDIVFEFNPDTGSLARIKGVRRDRHRDRRHEDR